MSTQNPIESTSCDTCTGWFRCKIKALTCKLQKLIEPLCEKNYDFVLARKDWVFIVGDIRTTNGLNNTLNICLLGTSAELREIIEANNFVTSEKTRDILAPRLTLWNKVGILFATGTSCPCCLGWRVAIGIVFGVAVGYGVGKL